MRKTMRWVLVLIVVGVMLWMCTSSNAKSAESNTPDVQPTPASDSD